MNARLAAAGALAAAALGGAGWYAFSRDDAPARPAATEVLSEQVEEAAPPAGVETVDGGDPAPVDHGTTPMNRRVAVLGLLNKRNGASRDLTLSPGRAVRVGDVAVRLIACERTAPW